MRLITDLRILLLALWLGAALFFSFAVAQSAFAVLPSRELAGTLVNRTLAIINYSGIVSGIILLASAFLIKQNAFVGNQRAKIIGERILLLVLTAACAVGQFVIAAKLHNLREQINRPIEELAANDPLRAAFDNWHQYSVVILLTAMIAAFAAFFLIVRRAAKFKYR